MTGKLYTAHVGKELICVGDDPDHLNEGIAMWNSMNPKGYVPKITVIKQDYTVHPRWLDMAYFAKIASQVDTR